MNVTKIYDDNDLQRLYDESYFTGRAKPPMWKRRAEFIIEKFHPKRTLDIGSATGDLVKSLNDLGVDAYGVDGSDYAILHVDPNVKNKIFKVNLNCDKLPFEDNALDLITGFYSIEHIHNVQFFANEIYRTLKNTGLIWFLTPNVDIKGRNDYDVFNNKFEDWKKIFEIHGFNVRKFSPHEMLTLKGKLRRFRFYKLPRSVQNIVKRIAYDISNRTSMKDTSFVLTKA